MLWLRHLLTLVPLLGAALWSCQPALLALMAVLTFEPAEFSSLEWERTETHLNYSRSIQRHFRLYATHIPLDDIMHRPVTPNYQEKLFLQLDQACGHGNVYVWVPIHVRLPLTGIKAFEWCWIPQLRIGKKSDP